MDKRPYRMEFELPEASGAFPRLEFTNRHVGVKNIEDTVAMLRARAMFPDYTGGTMSTITIRQGPVVDLLLTEDDVTLIEKEKGKKDSVVMTSAGIPKKGFLESIFPGAGKEAGVKLHVSSSRSKDTLEATIPLRETYGLTLQYGKMNIVGTHAETGPLLAMFLMEGSLWLRDSETSTMCIMSTERESEVDKERFEYFAEPIW